MLQTFSYNSETKQSQMTFFACFSFVFVTLLVLLLIHMMFYSFFAVTNTNFRHNKKRSTFFHETINSCTSADIFNKYFTKLAKCCLFLVGRFSFVVIFLVLVQQIFIVYLDWIVCGLFKSVSILSGN